MARPKKETVDYFPHIANSGKTIFILESQFGNDGYAFWFKTLELLASTDGHVIDCRNTSEWKFLLAKTNVSEDIGSRILDQLAELEAIDYELWQSKVIWSDNFIKNIADVYKNRKTGLPKKPVIEVSTSRNHSEDELLPVETTAQVNNYEQSTNRNPQSKVKETKVNKTKVNYTESSQSQLQSVLHFYQNNFGVLSNYIQSDLMQWCSDLSPELAIKAMQIAQENQKSYNYAKGIMQNWLTKGIKTLDDVEAEQRQFQKNKVPFSRKQKKDELKPYWAKETQDNEKNEQTEQPATDNGEDLLSEFRSLMDGSKDDSKEE